MSSGAPSVTFATMAGQLEEEVKQLKATIDVMKSQISELWDEVDRAKHEARDATSMTSHLFTRILDLEQKLGVQDEE